MFVFLLEFWINAHCLGVNILEHNFTRSYWSLDLSNADPVDTKKRSALGFLKLRHRSGGVQNSGVLLSGYAWGVYRS